MKSNERPEPGLGPCAFETLTGEMPNTPTTSAISVMSLLVKDTLVGRHVRISFEAPALASGDVVSHQFAKFNSPPRVFVPRQGPNCFSGVCSCPYWVWPLWCNSLFGR